VSARLSAVGVPATYPAEVGAAERWLRRRAVASGTVTTVAAVLLAASALIGVVAMLSHPADPYVQDSYRAVALVAAGFAAAFATVAAVAGTYWWTARVARRLLRRDGFAVTCVRVMSRSRCRGADLATFIDMVDDDGLYTAGGPAIGVAGWEQLTTRPDGRRFVWNGRRGFLVRRCR
jgi:hypothetical protein